MAEVSISTLVNEMTGEPSNRDNIYTVVDDTTANQTKKMTLNTLFELVSLPTLTTAISATDTTITHPTLDDLVGVGDWVVVGAYTTDAEMRRVTAVSAGLVTVSRQFDKAHSVGARLLIARSGLRNVLYFGAEGDGTTDDSAAIQAAVDDFDSAIVGDPPQETKSNGLFFPAGDFVINTPVRLPFYHTFNAGKPTIAGANPQSSNLLITSGVGPFFRPIEDHGTHDGANNASTLSDSTKSFPLDGSLEELWIFNVTDGSYGAITGNGSTTITATLTGGTDNDWDTGDVYHIGAPSNKWVFKDLAFRDQTNTWPTTGNAQAFEWLFYRSRWKNVSVSNFSRFIGSYDLTDTAEFLQSVSVIDSHFDSCKEIVAASKGWEFLFSTNECDSCGEPIKFLATSDAAMINGRILNNTFQGAGPANGAVIEIKGPNSLVVAGNYFENTNGSTRSLIAIGTEAFDDRDGTPPQGVTIGPGNSFEPTDAQNANRDWTPISIHSSGDGVTVHGNHSKGRLLHIADNISGNGIGAPNPNFGFNWQVFGNRSLYDQPSGQQEFMGPGTRKIRKIGREQTSGTTTDEMLFDDSHVFSVGDASPGAVYAVDAWLVAVQDNGSPARDETAKIAISALFEHNANGTFVKVGSDESIHTTIASAGAAAWTAAFAAVSNDDTFTDTDVNTSTDEITITGHGLANNAEIYFTTDGTLPAPLVANRGYYVTAVDVDTIKVSLRRGGAASDDVVLTDGGTGTHTIHEDNILLNVTGDTGDTVIWHAEVVITIGVL